jgi:fumarylacetoacetate (FAA) hydrolase
MLANGWRLRELEPAERATGCGFVQSRPATAFGPVAVTPDELGDAWRGGRVHLEIESALNGQRLGRGNAGDAMNLHFGELVAHLAMTRRVRAGSIVGSGTVSHTAASQGCHSIAEKRSIEGLDGGTPKTAFARFGDRIRIELHGADGMSVFGAIEQQVAAP